jgi:hypothetical protein
MSWRAGCGESRTSGSEGRSGETSQGNLGSALLIDPYTLIHQSEWDVAMVHGIPTFYPPRWLDEQRKPRRNFLHLAA